RLNYAAIGSEATKVLAGVNAALLRAGLDERLIALTRVADGGPKREAIRLWRRAADQHADLDLSRQNFAARLDQRDFRNQFFNEQIAKGIEVSCDQDKSTGTTDHVLSIILFKPTWRIHVFRSPRGRLVGENNQAVDRNPSPNCLVSRRAHITSAIVIAVS